MNAKDKILLQKIRKYIREAVLYTKGMTFEQFMKDGKTVSATAFVASQMGELANNISPPLSWRRWSRRWGFRGTNQREARGSQ